MRNNYHKITAITLAFLVLFSTTGISMNVVLCHCTGQQYLSVLMPKLDCCKKKEAQQKEISHVCCSKKTSTTCSKEQHQLSVETDKKCCSSNFKYSKANINLELTTNTILPSFVVALVPNIVTVLPTYNYVLLIPQVVTVIGHPNKAPPKPFGSELLHLIQNYRC